MSKKLTSSCNDALQSNQKKNTTYRSYETFILENQTYSVASEPFVGYNSKYPLDEFDLIQKSAVRSKGIVMPKLNSKYVNVLHIKAHDFDSEYPLIEARKWAEKNLVGVYTSHVGTIDEFEYMISKIAIKKYIQSCNESDSIYAHLSVLKVLPKVIDSSIEVEIHPDYTKVNGERTIKSPINDKVLIHRFYGAINLDGENFRIKVTIQEYKQTNVLNKPYSFEVIRIELLDESNSSIPGIKVADSIETDQLSVAKLLQNVEKSYDKGKFLLDESEN
jgi:hypothetical protein